MVIVKKILKIRVPYKVKLKQINKYSSKLWLFFYRFSYVGFDPYCEWYALIGLHLVYRWWYLKQLTVYKSFLLKIITKQAIKKFKVYPVNSDNLYSATGEEFVELMSCGEFDGKLKKKFKTTLGTILAYRKELRYYLKNKTGTIFWRIEPELAGLPFRYAIYSRLLISNKAIKEVKLSC